jgi:hypothetical protein
VRLPYTRPVEGLTRAVDALAAAWFGLSGRPGARRELTTDEAYVV